MKFHDILALKKLKYISCSISFDKKISSKDARIIKKLILNKKKSEVSELILKESEFYKLVKDKRTSPETYMKSLSSKRINLEFYYKDSYLATLMLPILIYGKIGEHFILTLSDKFLELFDERYLYHKLGLHNIFLMTHNNSRTLYLYLYKEFTDLEEVEVSLSNLKKLLSIERSYTRFYDFEKYVLAPLIRDMNSYLEEKITYKKKRSGKSIDRILFFQDKSPKDLGIQDLFDIIKDYCNNHYQVLKALEQVSKETSLKEIRKELYKAILDYDTSSTLPFDLFLESRLHFKKDATNTILIKKVFQSPSELHGAIYHELEKIGMIKYFDFEFFGFNFFNEFAKVKDTNKPAIFENEKLKISIYYKENRESKIHILLKENVVVVV